MCSLSTAKVLRFDIADTDCRAPTLWVSRPRRRHALLANSTEPHDLRSRRALETRPRGQEARGRPPRRSNEGPTHNTPISLQKLPEPVNVKCLSDRELK